MVAAEFKESLGSFHYYIPEGIKNHKISLILEDKSVKGEAKLEVQKEQEDDFERIRVYNIKRLTDKMAESQIDQIIQDEVQMEAGPELQWAFLCNKLIRIEIDDGVLGKQADEAQLQENELSGSQRLLNCDSGKLLKQRRKGQRLSTCERQAIWKMIEVDQNQTHVSSSRYCVSKSTIKRILKEGSNNDRICLAMKSSLGIKELKTKRVKIEIIKLIQSQEAPFRCKDVCEFLRTEHSVKTSPRIIAKLLNDELGMPFKKASSRLVTLDTKMQYKLKILFAVILCKHFKKAKLLLNVDEYSVSRLTKEHYTWLLREAPESCKNISLAGSMNFITAIGWSGSSYSAIGRGPTNSQKFIVYLNTMLDCVQKNEGIAKTEVTLLIDNAPIHQACDVLKYLERQGIACIFIPKYAPEVAPVESYFGVLKQSLKRCTAEVLNLKTELTIQIVEQEIHQVSSKTIPSLWRHFYSKVRGLLDNLKEKQP